MYSSHFVYMGLTRLHCTALCMNTNNWVEGQCVYNALAIFKLKYHVKSIHEGVHYPCDQCDYKASQIYKLKTHVKSFH